MALVNPIKKLGKNSVKLGSYRPISLLQTIGKIVERNILIRFGKDRYKDVIPEQYGFRQGHNAEP